ncbi:MAG: PilZ domain-containing protein [Spirochaetes bacterium]|nr:PilZ domain-containing protein [Spirochaetota bacterium]
MKHLPREHQRAYITFYLRLFEGEQFLGFIIDISREGIKLLSEMPLAQDKEYSLKMKVPSSLEWQGRKDVDRHIQFSARCIWSKHDYVDKDFYISGFNFTEFKEEDQSIIHAMIAQYRIP